MKTIDDSLKTSTKDKCDSKDKYISKDKIIPLSSEEVSTYIDNLSKAKAAGINVPIVYDYQINSLLPSMTRISLIEEKIPGQSIDNYSYLLCRKDKDNIALLPSAYLTNILLYEEELSRRALAPQKMYDKYFADYKNLEQYHLYPSADISNFLFDEVRGFSLISPLPNSDIFSNTDYTSFLEKYISTIIGFNLPKIIIDYESVELIPCEDLVLIKKYLRKIIEKICITLKCKGYSNHIINEAIVDTTIRFNKYLRSENLSREEMPDYIIKKYSHTLGKKRGR